MKERRSIQILIVAWVIVYLLPMAAFLTYKLTYPELLLLRCTVREFGGYMVMLQGAILGLTLLPLTSDLAYGKKWYNKVLIYFFSFVIAYAISYGITGLFDLITGEPWYICK